MSDEKLIRMANQIAAFFATQPEADKPARVAAHIRDFWAPPMRESFMALAQSPRGAALSEIAKAAAAKLAHDA